MVRFSAYDLCIKALADEHGQVSGLRNLFAGAITGACESIFVVAPVESLRIALIDGNRKGVSGYRDSTGILRMAKLVYQQDGAFHGVYRGVTITVLRQIMNSSVLFWSYSSLKQGLEGNLNVRENPLPLPILTLCSLEKSLAHCLLFLLAALQEVLPCKLHHTPD